MFGSSSRGAADLLSNEELLGLTSNSNNIYLNNNQNQNQNENNENGINDDNHILNDATPQLKAPRRTLHKITDDLLLGPRGLKTLTKSLNSFKFKPKPKSNKNKHKLTSYEIYKNSKYENSNHFENLTKLLYIYQSWCHDIYPKYKFRDVIPILNRAVNTPIIKHHKRELIENEISLKLSKINNIDNDDYNNDNDDNIDQLESVSEVQRQQDDGDTHTNMIMNDNSNHNTSSGGGLFVAESDEEDGLYTSVGVNKVPTTTTTIQPQQQQQQQKQIDSSMLQKDDDYLKELDSEINININHNNLIANQDDNNDGSISQDEFSDDGDDSMFQPTAGKISHNKEEEEEDIPEELIAHNYNDQDEEMEDEMAILREMGM
ncbi:hypothetical protein CANARDRAFT_28181 [[Candida] arabinofermentans NRRL YB-2248]|uniref:Chromosome segregation in meiosis protein n=1 Tax=[Candida] arabinofermentans NRRL YB-2248 TaxID=983967 RepID=A0A1E4T0T7_9ASCO|nr:hypothetical protein CANARDRAFT_28181 [[Candida] arabinofermentans NRRL YB-2248]